MTQAPHAVAPSPQGGVSYSVSIEGMEELLARIPDAEKRRTVARNILLRIGTTVKANAVPRIPRRTGNTARSVLVRVDRAAMTGYVGDLGSAVGSRTRVGAFLERGTGIYGPSGQRIFPKRARALRWASSREGKNDVTLGGRHRTAVVRAGAQQWSFAKSIKGMKAQPWLKPAWDVTLPHVPEILKAAEVELFAAGVLADLPGDV